MGSVEKYPIVTLILVFLYVSIFLADRTIFNGALLQWGSGKSFDYMQRTEWYRLLTGTFFHQDLLHLVGNTFAIYFVGIILENKIGSWTFLLIYLIGNIGTSIIYAKIASFTQGIGASPGIYAVIACILILYLYNPNFINLHFGTWAVNYTLFYLILGNFYSFGALIVHIIGFCLGSVVTVLIILVEIGMK